MTEGTARCRCLRCGAEWVDRLVAVRGPGLSGWAWASEACPRCGGFYWERVTDGRRSRGGINNG